MKIRTTATRDTIIPVLVLALDTTTRAGSVAVARGDELLALVEGDGSRTHGERLPAEIARALDSAGVKAPDLDLLVVASGPGAFTGLRIGLAAIQGLAMVLDKPVVGVSALDALAETVRRSGNPPAVAAWIDAQRGEVYAGWYRAGSTRAEALTPPLVAAAADTLARSPFAPDESVTFVGDGAVRYRALIEAAFAGAVVMTPAPLAPMLAQLGRRAASRGESGPPHTLQPLYVRRPDAELARARKEDGWQG
jgi:tRNA threonylcarbamoyladenosine biosynthesis protein TsaB